MGEQRTGRAVLLSIKVERYDALLTLRGKTAYVIARELGLAGNHVREVLHGRRGATPRVLAALKAAVGEAGWAFACGERDELQADA